MKSKKVLAVLLAASVSLTSVQGVFASEADIFSAGEDSEEIFMDEEAASEGEAGEFAADEFSNGEEQPELFLDEAPIVEAQDDEYSLMRACGIQDEEGLAAAGSVEPQLAAAFKNCIRSNILNFEKTVYVGQYKVPQEEMSALIEQTLCEMPPAYRTNIGLAGYGMLGNSVHEIYFSYTFDRGEFEVRAEKYQAAIDAVLSGVNSNWSDAEKLLYVHDYLALHCEYDFEYKRHSAYDALVDGKAVCDGYTNAFAELARQMGIESRNVVSRKMDHAWNMVKIGSSWYFVDVTFDDPVIYDSRIDESRSVWHNYFLKSNAFYHSSEGTHNVGDYVISGGGTPEMASDTSYDNAFWHSLKKAVNHDQNYWYTKDSFGEIEQYRFVSQKPQSMGIYKTITEKWKQWGTSDTYQKLNFSGFETYRNKVYYSTPTKLFAFDSNGEEEIYELSAEEESIGYIYDIKFTGDGVLQYILKKSSDDSAVKTGSLNIQPHEHQYTCKRVKEPGCGSEGKDVYTCSICGKFYSKTIAPTGKHTFGEWKMFYKPTCRQDGEERRYCSDCQFNEKRVVKAGEEYHVWDEWYVSITGGCTNGGRETRNCKVCMKLENRDLPAVGHQWGDWKVIREPDSVIPGVEARTCSKCNREETREIPVISHTHQWSDWTVEKKADCHTAGLEARICPSCQKKETREIPKTTHKWSDWVVEKEADEQSAGEKSRSCSICGDKETEEIPMLNHTHKWSDWTVEKKADCHTAGLEARICPSCQKKETREIPKTTHKWSDWVVEKEADEQSAGKKSRSCSICGDKETEEIPMLNHTHKWSDWTVEKKADCHTAGLEARICPTCQKKETREIPKTTHKWSDWVVEKEADEQSAGVKSRSCSICGDKETEEIPMLNHTHKWSNWTVEKKADCHTAGLEARICPSCQKKETREIPKTTHKWSDWTVEKEASTQHTGVKSRSCSICGDKETKEIPVLTHTHKWGEWMNDIAMDCEEDGKQHRICSICSEIQYETIPKTGHDMGEWEVIEKADCYHEGLEERYCDYCRLAESRILPKTTHKWGKEKVMKKATLSANGYTRSFCENCMESRDKKIPYPKYITLSASSFNSNGKVQRPEITVKGSDKKVISPSNYKITYSKGCINAGTYKVKISFTGAYSGSVKKSFKINPASYIITLREASKGKAYVSWKKISGAAGYQIQYADNSKFKNYKRVSINNKNTYKTLINGIEGGKTYYVRVRSYKKASGKNVYSKWSEAKKVKIKK